MGKRKDRQPGEPLTIYIRLEPGLADEVAARAAQSGDTENKWAFGVIYRALQEPADIASELADIKAMVRRVESIVLRVLVALGLRAGPGSDG